jgi:DeoR/GlpR family transcriptional regulator of sugar metabolism
MKPQTIGQNQAFCRMLAPQRRESILALLRERGRVYSAELSQQLDVSEDTVRRDLLVLAEEGHLVRTHGGAVPRSTTKLEFHARSRERPAEKEALARRAATLVQANHVVFFDAGSTILAVARAIPADLTFTAVTHSLPAAIALSDLPNIEVILLGGRILKRGLATVGVESVESCRRIHADLALVGIAALDAEGGITDPSYEESLVKRAVIENASKVVVVSTADKLGSACPFQVAPTPSIDVLITEANVPAATLDSYRTLGVDIIAIETTPGR